MNKADLQTRADIYLLVETFYSKVQKNSLLGPIFNAIITNWDVHLAHLTTFWESTLFVTRKLDKKYSGNPLEAHIQVDNKINNTITEKHFGVWLNLWIETIDELYAGEIANNAKLRARRMSTFMYLNIFAARKNKGK